MRPIRVVPVMCLLAACAQDRIVGPELSPQPQSGTVTVLLRRCYPSSQPQGEVPLYVIDGVLQRTIPRELPADIERIEIMKGAEAVPLYGSQAANGVVRITTVGGRAGGS